MWRYTIARAKDGQWGAEEEDGSWNGLVGAVVNGVGSLLACTHWAWSYRWHVFFYWILSPGHISVTIILCRFAMSLLGYCMGSHWVVIPSCNISCVISTSLLNKRHCKTVLDMTVNKLWLFRRLSIYCKGLFSVLCDDQFLVS